MRFLIALLSMCAVGGGYANSVLEKRIQKEEKAAKGVVAPKAQDDQKQASTTIDASDVPEDRSQLEGRTIEEILRLRDPFKKLDSVFKKKSKLVTSELELFPLSEFKLAAVVAGRGKDTALVIAPNGKSYYIKVSQKIGDQGGIVTKITPEALHVREKTINILGQEEETTSYLYLSAKRKLGEVKKKRR